MSYASPQSFLKVRLPLCCSPSTPSLIAGSLGSRQTFKRVNALPCPQSHLPAAICSLLPWFLILPDQICHAASKGDRLQLMPLPLSGQLADLLLHRAVGCLLTEDWAQTSGYAFLCQGSAPVNLRRIQHVAHYGMPLQTFVQESHPRSKY